MSTPTVFHSLTFRDAHAAMTWLEAVGFRRIAVSEDGDNVAHAEFAWGDCGGIMFGSPQPDHPDDLNQETGTAKCYCVVPQDADVDAVFDRAIAAGGTAMQEPNNPGYGGRTCTVSDPEGNQWSFGSYRGAQA